MLVTFDLLIEVQHCTINSLHISHHFIMTLIPQKPLLNPRTQKLLQIDKFRHVTAGCLLHLHSLVDALDGLLTLLVVLCLHLLQSVHVSAHMVDDLGLL